MTRLLRGVEIAPGVARGTSVLWTPAVVAIPLPLENQAVAEEIKRLYGGVEETRRQLKTLQERLVATLGESQAYIVEAQLHILDDRRLFDRVERIIREQQTNAEWALEVAFRELARRFEQIEDPYLKERISDIADVIHRVQTILAGREPPSVTHIKGPLILVGHELAPSVLLEWIQRADVRGILLGSASVTSHVAIMARSLGIPAVGGIQAILDIVPSGVELLIDGYDGTVIIEPTPLQVREYESKRKYFVDHLRALATASRGPAETVDGRRIRLLANLEHINEANAAIRYDAEGVGLFRSEYLFLGSEDKFLDEGFHVDRYRELIQRFGNRPVTIRLADLAQDKVPGLDDYQSVPNPALGLRALRLTMRRRELLDPQIRAVLRVAREGNVRLLLPFIAAIEEIVEMLEIIDENRRVLEAEGVAVAERVPIGVMIEVPSMALMIPEVSELVDFISIGTNDLIQFLMAADRGAESLRYLYRPFHPPVLRTLARIIEDALAHDLEVNVCGEMAADIPSVLLLVGLGCPVLSMNPQWLPAIRFLIQTIAYREVRELAQEALTLPMGKAVEETVLEWIQSRFPEGIFHHIIRRVGTASFRSPAGDEEGTG